MQQQDCRLLDFHARAAPVGAGGKSFGSGPSGCGSPGCEAAEGAITITITILLVLLLLLLLLLLAGGRERSGSAGLRTHGRSQHEAADEQAEDRRALIVKTITVICFLLLLIIIISSSSTTTISIIIINDNNNNDNNNDPDGADVQTGARQEACRWRAACAGKFQELTKGGLVPNGTYCITIAQGKQINCSTPPLLNPPL